MLSILIPTYNYTIVALVQKVHQQCLEAQIIFEIICMDDQSDNAFQLENQSLSSLSNCYYFNNEVNLGRTQTRKKLAEKAQYDWLLFLDADVLPVHASFIKNYIKAIQPNSVIFGGYQYEKEMTDTSKILRYRYGKEREESPAIIRNKQPYKYVYSGNMMVPKSVFLDLNYQATDKFYGMDIYFGYQLFTRKIIAHQIDNPILHLGLETNEVYFKKALQAVESRNKFLKNKKEVELMNPLMHSYVQLRKWHLTKVVAFGFKIFAPILKKNILSSNPKMIYFDMYRLGYLCSIE